MESVRLILEQIDEARKLFASASILNLRLAMILLDNAAELVISRDLRHQFAMDDHWRHPRDSGYTEKERSNAEQYFDGKVRLVAKLGRLTKDQEGVLIACHQFRGEMFHGEHIRRAILRPATSLLFHTVTEIFEQLPPQSYLLPATDDEEHRAFMRRFRMDEGAFAMGVGLVEKVAGVLRDQVRLEADLLAGALSADLVERIDQTIESLIYLNEGKSERDVDHNLRHGQFWHAEGAKLMGAGVREPELSVAFEKWKSQGNAEFTLPRIKQWRKTSEGIAEKRAAEALRDYCGVDRKFRPLEDGVLKAVIDYDEQINMEIHDRRLRR